MLLMLLGCEKGVILDIVPVCKFVSTSSKQLLKESMDSKISNCTYFNKDIERIGPITSFVRYCVELSHRVGEVICKENHTLIHFILHEEK